MKSDTRTTDGSRFPFLIRTVLTMFMTISLRLSSSIELIVITLKFAMNDSSLFSPFVSSSSSSITSLLICLQLNPPLQVLLLW